MLKKNKNEKDMKKYSKKEIFDLLINETTTLSKKEVHSLILELGLRKKREFNLDKNIEIVVSDQLNDPQDGVFDITKTNGKKTIFLNTNSFPFEKEKLSDLDRRVILEIIGALYHEMAHFKQYDFFEKKIDDYAANFPYYDDEEIDLMNNLLATSNKNEQPYFDYKVFGDDKYGYYYQAAEYFAFKSSVRELQKEIGDFGMESPSRDEKKKYYTLLKDVHEIEKIWHGEARDAGTFTVPYDSKKPFEQDLEIKKIIDWEVNRKAFSILMRLRKKALKKKQVDLSRVDRTRK